MIPEKIIYTDGHDVVVTDTSFNVKKQTYNLNGIIGHWLQTLIPNRIPFIVLLIAGSILLLLGLADAFPSTWNMKMGNDIVLINPLMVWIGIGLSLLATIVLIFLSNRYAVRISTAEGEKNAIVSTDQEYIKQIITALNKAFSVDYKNPRKVHPMVIEVEEVKR